MAFILIMCVVILCLLIITMVRKWWRARPRRRCKPKPIVCDFLDNGNHVVERINEAPPVRRVTFATPIMHMIETFAERAPPDDMFMNLRVHGLEDILIHDYNVPIVHIEERRPDLRRDLYVATTKAEPKTGETKIDTLDRVINQSITHTSDSQNVHDSDVQTDIKKIAAKLNVTLAPKVVDDKILEYIVSCTSDPTTKQKAIETLDTIKNRGIHISAVGATEQQILNSVWRRAHDVENAPNKENILNSLVDSLAACIENNRPVCSTGRSTNLLSSLCLLDYDSNVSKIGTSEMYKNEILEKANSLLKTCIEDAKNSTDANMKKLGASFDDATISSDTIPSEIKETFKKEYESKINTLSSEFKDHWSARIRNELMQVVDSVL